MQNLNSKLLCFSHWASKQFKAVKIAHFIHTILNSNPTRFQSNWVLRELSKSGRIDEARQVFDKMCDKDDYTWNTMVAAYSNSGRFVEARELFDEIPCKNSVSWSTLISGYSRYGNEVETFELYRQMQLGGQKPTHYTLGSILRVCSHSCLVQTGEALHGYAIKTGLGWNVYVVTGLVDMYAKCKRISEAENLFMVLHDKENHVLWTTMVTGYAQNGDGLKAMKYFHSMRAAGVESNQFTFPSILAACAAVSAHSFGSQVHGCIVQSGFGSNTYVQSALVDMYAKCGDLDSAMDVLESMETDDAVSWNSMIVGCVRLGFEEEALSLFKNMHARDMKIDDYTFPSVLNCCIVDNTNSKAVHCLIIKTGYGNYKVVNNSIVDMYAKMGDLHSAWEVFDKMLNRDVISWTSLITGYVLYGSHEKALKLYCDMKILGTCSDQFIIASVLSACGELTLLKFGKQVHSSFIRSGLRSSLSIDNSLVAMYAKCGCLEDANQVFDLMQVRNVITWTALIVGYAKNGKGKDSLRYYDEMISNGIKPDFITFIGLLFACSHAGLVEDGRAYFEKMDKIYGIKPGAEHYACMIDLLGRSGNLKEAKELLNHMDVRPDATVWKALLAACRLHGDIELGKKAAESLFVLEPMNAMPYVLLCNMYSADGKWEDAARIRGLMKSRGISKEPGCSWIEMDSEVHTFMSEDRGHPREAEIYLKIDEILTSIKEAGYVPDMSYALHDMDREGKELGLAYHSEKLAVAFGLLSLPSGAPIRIFKNLRVCGDCHTAMKYISKVFVRHIILRDSNCFHHFEEGKCSCGDYW